VIPTGAIVRRIVPKFVNDLPDSFEFEIVNQISQNLNFGLRYDANTISWKIITGPNLNLFQNFSLGKAGDITNTNLDSSWIIAFVKEADEYIVRIRTLDYVFGSVEQNRFYFDVNEKQYNDQTGSVIKDYVKVLGINTSSDFITQLKYNINFEIDDTIKFDDGYESSVEIKVAFSDRDSDGVIDNPEAFEQIVGEDLQLNFLFFKDTIDASGSTVSELVDTEIEPILSFQRETQVNINDFDNGQLLYFYDPTENQIKRVNKSTNTLDLESEYRAVYGRDRLKFQYVHNASVDRRIDPSISNIIDIFLLTRSYDEAYRIWLSGNLNDEPQAPSSDELRINFGSALNSIKSISDEIIYFPVKYKVLFGAKAEEKLQARFKVVKNPNKSINDNDLKVRIINAIEEFFDVTNWDFGDKFYLSELTTFVINSVAPDVSNMIIVPRQNSQVFGSLFEIQSAPDEIFISGATVDDIEIVPGITAAEVRAAPQTIVIST
jgi:hypothetical protein